MERKEVLFMNSLTTAYGRKNLSGLALMLVLAALVVAISNPVYTALHRMSRADLPQPPMALTDGTYTYMDTEFDDSGYKNQVTLTVFDGYITGVAWDCIDQAGAGKRQLSLDGQYIMTEDGLLWAEQSDAVSSYVLANQTLDGLIDESGYTQAVASVSINLYGFVNAVNACLEQAAQ